MTPPLLIDQEDRTRQLHTQHTATHLASKERAAERAGLARCLLAPPPHACRWSRPELPSRQRSQRRSAPGEQRRAVSATHGAVRARSQPHLSADPDSGGALRAPRPPPAPRSALTPAEQNHAVPAKRPRHNSSSSRQDGRGT